MTNNIVFGKVTDANDSPLANVKVEILHADMRDWQLLAETFTNRDGQYEGTWSRDQLKERAREETDIVVKVLTKKTNTEIFRSSIDDVRFKASDREEINIKIRQPLPKEDIEFSFLVNEVSSLAKRIPITELQENEEHRDVTFLSKELEVPAEKIEHLVMAHRLANSSKINPVFFYGLFRMNTLIYNNTENKNMRLSVGLTDDENIILYDLALTDQGKIYSDIQQAAEEMIIPSMDQKDFAYSLTIINTYIQKAVDYYENEHPQKINNLFNNLFKEEKIQEMLELLGDDKKGVNAFFEKLFDPSLFAVKKEEKANTKEQIKVLDKAVLDKRTLSKTIENAEDVKKLASLNKAEWIKELERAETPVLKNQKKIVSFLNKYDDFDLTRDNVDLYLKEKKVEDTEAINEELKSVQRVFRLVPNYSKTMALREQNIKSSQSIVAIGEKRFVNEVALKAGIDEREAEKIYQLAETRNNAALLIMGNLHDNLRATDIASFNSSLLSKLKSLEDDFPNLKSLFKLVDNLECENCRSVYSPAAYLVEILQFLEKRTVIAKLFKRRPDLGDIDLGGPNSNTPVKYIDLVCEILEEVVAPDKGVYYTGVLSDESDPLKGKISAELQTALAGLKVSSDALIYETESAYETESSTTGPYYLRDKGIVCKIENIGESHYKINRLRQTFATAEELDAAPEYVNEEVYKKLLDSKYAFKLPFDLFHTEAKEYFNRFGLNRADLMRAFQSEAIPTDANIAVERLGLTAAETDIIVKTPSPNDNAAQQQFWNVPTYSSVVDYLKRVDYFLDKTGLTYKELDLLLKLKFIDNNKNLYIRHDELSGDTAKKSIINLDLDVVDRIHRFLRLQKKTGLKFEVLDEIISQKRLGEGRLDEKCLIKIAEIKEITEKITVKIEELIGCYGEIPHAILNDGIKPLYEQIFLNKAKNGAINEEFLPENFANGSNPLNDVNNISYLAACLQLNPKDLMFLIPFLPDKNLSFSNLSFLFAASKLITKLKIKAEDFAIISKLSGIKFSSSPKETVAFIKVAEDFKHVPLNANNVEFILEHKAQNIDDKEIKVERIEELLGKLKSGYEAVCNKCKSKYDGFLPADEQKENLQSELAKLNGITAEDVKIFSQFIDCNWKFEWINDEGVVNKCSTLDHAAEYLEYKLASIINIDPIHHKFNLLNDAFNTYTTNGEDQDAIDFFETARKDLVEVFLDETAAFHIQTNKQILLEQTMSSAFKLDLNLTKTVLTFAKLKQLAPGNESLDYLLFDNFGQEITPVIYAKQYAAIRLVFKLASLISAFKLSATEAEWYLKNNADPALGWFEMDGIPYQSEQTVKPFSTFLEFSKIISWSRRLTPVTNPLDAERPVNFFSIIELILKGTTSKDDFMNLMALLSGYEKEDLANIDKHLFSSFDIVNYRDIEIWERLFKCADFARKLGTDISQINKFTGSILSSEEAEVLRANLKSKYDEDTWLSTLKEIMDAVRPQKRDALVAYLLAEYPDKYKNENDLYEHYLVDVEMEASMPSSRIVLAHNSVQLFVQRCLMGLEPDAIADADADPGWNQWQWMKNYRVWEANRKVFLYPENWYDVTLTDDKSYLLKEFIDEIQQNELTNDIAEEAIMKYMEKLDDIAFLEVTATWYDVPARVMHVFARTKGGEPYIYYYRRFESERYWSPWEKVDLDISGDHLLAFMRNNRLHLAWAMFSEEPQPDQKVNVPYASQPQVSPDKPKKKLKIQLAISEYSNGKWKPKKISDDSESLPTPTDYQPDPHALLRKGNYHFVYHEIDDQIWIFTGNNSGNYTVRGIFNIAGCKGYLELNKNTVISAINHFLPEFGNTEAISQRYKMKNPRMGLSVKNWICPSYFATLLVNTLDTFKITYPHQRKGFDMLIDVILRLLRLLVYGSASNQNASHIIGLSQHYETTFGSLLPYFFEDKKHAYVIIPGFYKESMPGYGIGLSGISAVAMQTVTIPDEKNYYLSDDEKRTASNIFKLIDDFIKWLVKKSSEFEDNLPENAVVNSILQDPFFQDFLIEIRKLNSDIFVLLMNVLRGLFKDSGIIDAFLKDLEPVELLKYGEQFKNMYHPAVCPLRGILYKHGVPALMKRDTQLMKWDTQLMEKARFDFHTHYNPNPGTVPQRYPVEDIDFESDGSYSVYNWDLFFRVPLHIAATLTQNQRFEEALTWFHYIFNPTGALPGNGVQKYWVTKPFYLNQNNDYIDQRIDSLMYATADKRNSMITELEFAIDEWRKKPFRPDVIARFRPVAYQKAVLMKYIDNLIEWGDYLFRQDTMESIAQATQMYVLADKLLGPKPRVVSAPFKQPYETYNQIAAKIDSFGNALIELENILPDLSVLPQKGNELPPPPVTLSMLYFCIPPNEKMFEYWDRVADRLFKIRHCQNIDGVERSLALFAPPIDPGMLVRAAASGLSLSSILAGLNAPTPYYRFNMLSQKATELAQEVRGLGNSLLQALEKKDSEELALLKNELELKVLNAVTNIKILQIDEAKEQIEVLKRTKVVTEERQQYYSSIEKIIPKEQLNLDKLEAANGHLASSQITRAVAGGLRLIPDFSVGASGFGGSPHVTAQAGGGSSLSEATNIAADIFNILSSMASYEANKASILGGYERRYSEWKLQERLAAKEIDTIDKQIKAAEFRKEIAEKDLANHELQIENAKKTDEFMRSKYTNKELYDWMIGQISAVYFKSYQLAHDFAKKAEMSYRFELGNDDSFISYGYWDSMKKGLQSADMLIHDIKRMETSYLEKNKREYEITKHVSLVQLDPLALLRLRTTGVCDFEIPEALYDMDYPGQYFRRLKSVSVSLPCVAGPYTSVSAKLSLVNNRYRKNTNDSKNYGEKEDGDERFVYNIGAIQSIATSNAQNDSGMFELNFRDERFLPFENTGAISSWRLELPTEIRQFNYNTITDVILHVKYTAREGGSVLKTDANGALRDQLNQIKQGLKNNNGLHIAINLKHDLPNEWHLLTTNGNVNLKIDKSRLPYMVNSLGVNDEIKVRFVSDCRNFKVTVDDVVKDITLASTNELGGMYSAIYPDIISLDESFNLSVTGDNNLEELLMIIKYEF